LRYWNFVPSTGLPSSSTPNICGEVPTIRRPWKLSPTMNGTATRT
jgi:hypothetical protein